MNNKCKIILTIILVLAILSAGYLFYLKYQESKQGYISLAIIEKTQKDGNFYLKNKESGLSLVVPDSWGVKNDEGGISVSSPDFEYTGDPSLVVPSRGCWMASTVRSLDVNNDIEYKETLFLLNDQNLEDYKNGENVYQIVYINNQKALKNILTVKNNKEEGFYQIVKLPYNNKLYYFETHLFGQDKERCQEEFESFLQAISIENK
jgi:hypothetical protein